MYAFVGFPRAYEKSGKALQTFTQTSTRRLMSFERESANLFICGRLRVYGSMIYSQLQGIAHVTALGFEIFQLRSRYHFGAQTSGGARFHPWKMGESPGLVAQILGNDASPLQPLSRLFLYLQWRRSAAWQGIQPLPGLWFAFRPTMVTANGSIAKLFTAQRPTISVGKKDIEVYSIVLRVSSRQWRERERVLRALALTTSRMRKCWCWIYQCDSISS